MTDIMPMMPTWADIGLRLLLTVLAGSLIGINRELGGHAAGFRTTVLVGLAACLAMIQANLMLPVGGKTDQSFAVMDTLRLPLGILTGVGFIGGGAILKRGDMVSGVTTAATLWIMTAIGLCLGGGLLLLGCAGAILAMIVLAPLKVLDDRLHRKQKVRLVIPSTTVAAAEIAAAIHIPVAHTRLVSVERGWLNERPSSTFELAWSRSPETSAEAVYDMLKQKFEIERFEVLGLEA